MQCPQIGLDINDPNVDIQGPSVLMDDNGDSSWLAKLVCTLYFFTFIILASYCILSMFVGAVMMSMIDSMIEMQKVKWDAKREHQRQLIEKRIEILKDPNRTDRSTKHTVRLIKLAFTGRSIEQASGNSRELRRLERRKTTTESQWEKWKWTSVYYFYKLVDICGKISESHTFNNFVTIVIIIASAEVGLQTDDALAETLMPVTDVLDVVIQVVFTAEVIIKIFAEGVTFWNYFNSHWNKFDFLIVFASFLPTGDPGMIMMLRLLRLLRVLKLLRAFPKLQVIVEALVKGLGSIFYIGIILFMWVYFFAIIGMIFFSVNDPWHFGTLHDSMLALFAVSTLDGWSAIMNLNLYGGCVYPEWDYTEYYDYVCEEGNPTPMKYDHPSESPIPRAHLYFAFTAIYFAIYVIIAAYLLLTLFIGVVGMSMEEATQEQKEAEKVMQRVEVVMEKFGIDQYQVNLYKEVFNMVDFTQSMKISRVEMSFGLRLAGNDLSDHDFMRLWRHVDKDGSNAIDFSEFLEFMFDLKAQREPVKIAKKQRKSGIVTKPMKLKYDMIDTKKVLPIDNDDDDDDFHKSEFHGPENYDLFDEDHEDTREEGTPDDNEDENFRAILSNIRSQIERLDKQRDDVLSNFPIWSNGGNSVPISAQQHQWQSPGPSIAANSPSPQSDPRPGSSGSRVQQQFSYMPFPAQYPPFVFNPYTGEPLVPVSPVPGQTHTPTFMPSPLPSLMQNPYAIPGASYPGAQQFLSPSRSSNITSSPMGGLLTPLKESDHGHPTDTDVSSGGRKKAKSSLVSL